MEVLDHDDRRPLQRQRRGEPRPGARQLLCHSTRFELVERIAGQGDAGCRGEREHGSLELLVERDAGEGGASAAEQLLAGLLRRVVERDAERLAKDLGQRPVGDSASGRRAAACAGTESSRRSRAAVRNSRVRRLLPIPAGP